VEVEFTGAESVHDGVENTELSGRQGTDHDATGAQSDSAKLDEPDFAGDVHQARHHRPVATSSLLVDLGEQRIGGVRDNRRRNTGNDTGREGNAKIHATRELRRRPAHGGVSRIGDGSLYDELRARVRNLFGKDGQESGVKASDAFGLGHFREAVSQTGRPGRIRNGADADGFQWTKEEVGDKLGTCRGTDVNASLMFPRLFVAEVLDGLDFEELDSAELEPALDEITHRRRPQAGSQGHRSFIGDNLLETADKPAVVLK